MNDIYLRFFLRGEEGDVLVVDFLDVEEAAFGADFVFAKAVLP